MARTHSFTLGTTPEDLIRKLCEEQCPDGYPMTIRSQREWRAIAAAVNVGIDGHLEALTERSRFDASTGECRVHPEELHVLLRRLFETDDPDPCSDDGEGPWTLRTDILSTLGVEEI